MYYQKVSLIKTVMVFDAILIQFIRNAEIKEKNMYLVFGKWIFQ